MTTEITGCVQSRSLTEFACISNRQPKPDPFQLAVMPQFEVVRQYDNKYTFLLHCNQMSLRQGYCLKHVHSVCTFFCYFLFFFYLRLLYYGIPFFAVLRKTIKFNPCSIYILQPDHQIWSMDSFCVDTMCTHQY